MSDVVAVDMSVEGDANPSFPIQSSEQSTKQFSVYEATSEELIERSMAPIKKEFLCPPPSRNGNQNDAADVKVPQSGLVLEKKSKRGRREKSAINLGPQVARTEHVNSCQYKEKCRFNHDIEVFKAQKPDDIEGQCPFVASEMKCAYGLACRFLGPRRDVAANSDGKHNSELNLF